MEFDIFSEDREIEEILQVNPEDYFKLSDSDETEKSQGERSDEEVPERFVVEGVPRVGVRQKKDKKRGNKRAIQKKRRNSGLSYIGTDNKQRPPRRLRPKCKKGSACQKLGWHHCKKLSEKHREEIRKGFNEQADLQKQREWIVSHTNRRPCENPKGRKKNSFKYFFPSKNGNGKISVCRVTFLNTLGISDKFVIVAWAKVTSTGTLEGENRGGNRNDPKSQKLREEIENHIDRFPKVESHYCRKFDHHQYLSPDLNVSKMYALYRESGGKASKSHYNKVFRTKGLRFKKPKKDLCPVCESFRHASDADKEKLRATYVSHTLEKKKVRDLKAELKLEAETDDSILVAAFDMQQVIQLPMTSRGDIFYKQRLNNLNFTLYELVTRDGFCFLWHQGIAKRGANEISSCLWSYLKKVDGKGYDQVHFFADGCPGQNKNSILPCMFRYFVSHVSVDIKTITIYFFEAHHGQNEGDAMHSVIERAKQKSKELFMPSQLATMMRLARKQPRPYIIQEMETSDILDWKKMSQESQILRVRQTDEGDAVDWTKVKAVRVSKATPNKIKVKKSHRHHQFQTISLMKSRRRKQTKATTPPGPAYPRGPPKVPLETYRQLNDIFKGDTPISSRQEYRDFYRNLPH
ncbi:uncharacterized protein [Amphiura filiformis]|uniref:uncharacterized protein n=1 Tax=Amphiura filiformis TaxID=82378 RepID=UPI003B226244